MSALTDLLLQGPRSAPELRQSLAISQATFSRLVSAHEEVVQFGKARATRYALIKPIRGTMSFPLWRVDAQGNACKFGVVYPCWPQGSCLVALSSGEWQWFDGLPWYITDLRPQGFLGRAWGRAVAGYTHLPDDIRLWQEDEVLYALRAYAGENTGGWIIGEDNYQRWIDAPEPIAIAHSDKVSRFQQLAEEALAGEIIGSSAGGEQPKFACCVQSVLGNQNVFVKFSAQEQSIVSVRWGDLLIAESIALSVLSGACIPASSTTVYRSDGGQVFLESARFDCVGVHGRRPIVSLESLQSEYVSSPGSWPAVTHHLAVQGYVDADSCEQTENIWAFGRLIANSDMHAGNLSFYLSAPPMALAPVYDMLPMSFAPSAAGSLRNEAVDIKVDATVSRAAWEYALLLAKAFWQQVADDGRISAGFRQIARAMLEKLTSAALVIQRLA
ncbi:type II toxin-antitoxin system HipA family toxin YjjJ [Citrobacter freundii]|nr:type II toxin-antitoxin system HipA family toxin YjjJ [Citrobacter freundii]EJB8561949.1 type II toxin-antitoxin system HipA family toxin YjjJ [Citrobacter freundii]